MRKHLKSLLVTLILAVALIFTATSCENLDIGALLGGEGASSGIALDKTELTLKVGELYQLNVSEVSSEEDSSKDAEKESGKKQNGMKNPFKKDEAEDVVYTWETSNALVATVKDGLVTAVGEGFAVITVRAGEESYATCTVTVIDESKVNVSVTEVKLNKTELTLCIGKSENLTVEVVPENATIKDITWYSSNTDVVTVENGVLTAVGGGKASVMASSVNGKYAKCEVTVNYSHVPGEAVKENEKAVSCTEDGSYDLVVYCDVCGEEISRTTETDSKTGHNYVDGKCDSCSKAELKASEGLRYTLSNDGTYYILSSTGSCTDTDIVIAEEYEGLPVKEIGHSVFSSSPNRRSITIPDSVTNIGDNVFFNCKDLVNIIVDDNNKVYKSIDGNLYSKDEKSLIMYAIGKRDSTFVIPESVTAIGDSAFCFGESLTSITIPSSVTYIGDCAFDRCSSLTSVTIPDGVTTIGSGAFNHCVSLASITIPDSVTYIGDSAFVKCLALKSITIPESITFIGDSTFAFCSNLTSITIPNGVTEIGDNAFLYCVGLTSVAIPERVASIGDHAFESCSSLASITIPSSVTKIGYSAFYYCTSITSIKIPGRVTVIHDETFGYCTNLKSIIIPNSVTSIGGWAFFDCTNLEKVYYTGTAAEWKKISIYLFEDDAPIDSSLTSATRYYYSESQPTKKGNFWHYDDNGEVAIWEAYVAPEDENASEGLAYTLSNDGTCYIVSGIGTCTDTDIVIPREYNGKPVTIIGGQAFYGANITSVTIPDSVTTIYGYAFGNCTNLTSITIPDSVTSVGICAFYGCTGLTQVIVGSSVTEIDDAAFHDCTALRNVYYMGSAENWKNVSAESAGAYFTNSLHYYYSESEPTVKGYFWRYDENGNVAVWENALPEISAGSEGLEYALNEYGAYYVLSGIGTCTDTDIVIADRYDGLPVKVIQWGVFRDCTDIVSVKIGNNVTSIGSSAFENCSSLTSVIIPNSVTSIGDHAFSGCSSLASIIIPDSVNDIGYSYLDGLDVIYYCGIPVQWNNICGRVAFPDGSINEWVTIPCYFYSENPPVEIGNFWHYDDNGEIAIWDRAEASDVENGSKGLSYALSEDGTYYIVFGIGVCTDTNVVIPDIYKGLPVKEIGYYSFNKANGIQSVTLPEGITIIDENAFFACTALTDINIPASVTYISSNAFNGCDSLTSITVSADNENYKDIDGNLYTKDGKTLLKYATGKDDTIFAIPDGVTTIYFYAFYDHSLTSIIIPTSLVNIYMEGFCCSYGDDGIVYYSGTEEEWNNIEIDSYENYWVEEATIYFYSESEPTAEGNFWYYDENGEIAVW